MKDSLKKPGCNSSSRGSASLNELQLARHSYSLWNAAPNSNPQGSTAWKDCHSNHSLCLGKLMDCFQRKWHRNVTFSVLDKNNTPLMNQIAGDAWIFLLLLFGFGSFWVWFSPQFFRMGFHLWSLEMTVHCEYVSWHSFSCYSEWCPHWIILHHSYFSGVRFPWLEATEIWVVYTTKLSKEVLFKKLIGSDLISFCWTYALKKCVKLSAWLGRRS